MVKISWYEIVLVMALTVSGAGGAWAADEMGQTSGPFRYHSGGRRDPFSPLVRDGRFVGFPPGGRFDGSKPVLYGILWDPKGHSIALINDAEVKTGDTIDGYQVTEIRQDAVVLTHGGEPVVLQIAFEAPRP